MHVRLALFASMTVFIIHAVVPAAASCGFEPLWRSIDRENVAAVFSGTVVGVESAAVGDILTFSVDAVWKGDASRMMVIYQPNGQPAPPLPSRSSIPPPQSGVVRGLGSGVGPRMSGYRPFYLSRRYVVVASRLTDEERTLFKLQPDREYLAATPCGGIFLDQAQATGELDRVGPGRAPQ
jgi:hypothetical protein